MVPKAKNPSSLPSPPLHSGKHLLRVENMLHPEVLSQMGVISKREPKRKQNLAAQPFRSITVMQREGFCSPSSLSTFADKKKKKNQPT